MNRGDVHLSLSTESSAATSMLLINWRGLNANAYMQINYKRTSGAMYYLRLSSPGISDPNRLDPSTLRAEGGAADTHAKGESTSVEGSKKIMLEKVEELPVCHVLCTLQMQK